MISRRWVMKALAACGAVPVVSQAAEMAPLSFNERPFRELQGWIAELPHEQCSGFWKKNPAKCIHDKREYVELMTYQFARPADVDMAIREVADVMKGKIGREIARERGDPWPAIHWRIPLEWDIQATERVVEYCEDGPDKDWITDRRCFMDRNWVRVAAYCRLHAA